MNQKKHKFAIGSKKDKKIEFWDTKENQKFRKLDFQNSIFKFGLTGSDFLAVCFKDHRDEINFYDCQKQEIGVCFRDD